METRLYVIEERPLELLGGAQVTEYRARSLVNSMRTPWMQSKQRATELGEVHHMHWASLGETLRLLHDKLGGLTYSMDCLESSIRNNLRKML